MPTKPKVQQYILLPARGMQAGSAHPGAAKFLMSLNHALSVAGTKPAMHAFTAASGPKMRIVDSIHEDGAKLVEMAADSVASLRASEPGIRIVPLVYYQTADHKMPRLAPRTKAQTAAAKTLAATGMTITVTDAKTKKPLRGVNVVAFTDFAAKAGAEGTTAANGQARLAFSGASKKVERLYLFPATGYWPGLQMGVTLRNGMTLSVAPIDLGFIDCVRFFYGAPDLQVGEGVKAAVIDTGISTNHPDLVVDGGMNTVTGEDPKDFGDNGGSGHATHVAGIIGARGTAPHGVRGIAPGVSLRSYRVFGKGSDSASNFAISKAIDAAANDGCDIINMSLGGGDPDPATEDAVKAARAAGVLVLAANGNDGRRPVSFPASFDMCIAVSAMGRKGTFPPATEPFGSIAAPFGADKNNFLADFSNIGPETGLIGPGVGVISSVPGGYGVMSGTSMACPAAAGAAARLLSTMKEILKMPRNQERSDAMAKAMFAAAHPLGFGPLFEGKGLLHK